MPKGPTGLTIGIGAKLNKKIDKIVAFGEAISAAGKKAQNEYRKRHPKASQKDLIRAYRAGQDAYYRKTHKK